MLQTEGTFDRTAGRATEKLSKLPGNNADGCIGPSAIVGDKKVINHGGMKQNDSQRAKLQFK